MEISKIDLTDRLRREGRWTEASLFRDAARKRLRAEGMSKIEAGEKSWELMAEEYTPTGSEAAEDDQDGDAEGDQDISAVLERMGENDVNLVRDVEWAYSHMANTAAAPADAPGPGSWALLCWARRNRNRFFEILLPKIVSVKSGKQDDRTLHEDSAVHIENLDAFERLSKACRAAQYVDCPGCGAKVEIP